MLESEIDQGPNVTDLGPSDRRIAMAFQYYALYLDLSVRDNLAFGLKVANTPVAEIDSRLKAATWVLKIDYLLDRQ